MDYREIQRTSLWKNKFPWKAHLKLNVFWTEETEIWNSVEDKEFILYLDETLNYFVPGQFLRQGAVIYCLTLDAIFQVRMRCDEKLIKIEKAVL